jgi:hypothetical protein
METNMEINKDEKVQVEVEEMESKVAPDIWDWMEELTSSPGKGVAAPDLRKKEAQELLRNIAPERR